MTWTQIAEQTSKTGYNWRQTGDVPLDHARALWDSGLVELCHRRIDGGFELVMLKRNKPVERHSWFYPEAANPTVTRNPPRHGSKYQYDMGCRCDQCRAAERDRKRSRKTA